MTLFELLKNSNKQVITHSSHIPDTSTHKIHTHFGVEYAKKMTHAQLKDDFLIKTHANFKQNRSRR